MIAALLWMACGSSSPQTHPRLYVEGAVFAVGEDLVVHAAQASVETTGEGQAQTVQATVRPEGDSLPLEIQAPTTTWDLQQKTARFLGGVVATRGPVTLNCDSLTVTFFSPQRLERSVLAANNLSLDRHILMCQTLLTSLLPLKTIRFRHDMLTRGLKPLLRTVTHRISFWNMEPFR